MRNYDAWSVRRLWNGFRFFSMRQQAGGTLIEVVGLSRFSDKMVRFILCNEWTCFPVFSATEIKLEDLNGYEFMRLESVIAGRRKLEWM